MRSHMQVQDALHALFRLNCRQPTNVLYDEQITVEVWYGV